jgi:phosphatidylserine/phosphatidylglycerophosphate/cardiolipin synthase-like enzyme
MYGWIVAFVLLGCLIVYIALDYKTHGYEKRAVRTLRTENKNLHRYIDQYVKKKKPDTAFAATFESVGMDSIENSLHQMINRAEFEILIVSPWIKETAWKRIRKRAVKFCNNGGELKVFIKGDEDDFRRGSSDRSVVNEISSYGGVVSFVPRLHAKLYVVDRREALITSANLSRSGIDFSYEAGVWTCNPALVKEVCGFVENLGG